MSTNEKRERVVSLVADWKASTLKQKAYSVLHEINFANLGSWGAKSKEQDANTKGFIEMTFGLSVKRNQIEIINNLFAGSHEAIQRSATIYSFIANCKNHDVNPYQWLKYTLENIMSINYKNIKDLYPQNYKQIIVQSNM